MHNPIFTNPDLCCVCGSDLPIRSKSKALKYCSKRCYVVGCTTVPQLTLRKARGMVQRNMRATGKPGYAKVARELGIAPDLVRDHCVGYQEHRRQRAEQKAKALCAAKVEKIRAELLADIRSWVESDPQQPYKDADILTGRVATDRLKP